jgi:Kef-type K+ transport system membrane component KefB
LVIVIPLKFRIWDFCFLTGAVVKIFYVLLILLAITRFFGEIAVRLKQPAVVGELLSGILLGVLVSRYSAVFPILSGLNDNEVFAAITNLGVFFLMLLAGIEMHPRKLLHGSAEAFSVACGGMVLPLGLGLLIGWFFLPASNFRFAQMMFLGVTLAVTAVPIAVKVLMELNKLNTRIGQITVSAALFDDVLNLLLLAVLTALMSKNQAIDALGLMKLSGEIILFFVITAGVGLYVLPSLEKLATHLLQDESEFAVILLIALGFAVLAEELELHFIIGAFAAGLFFTKRSMTPQLYDSIKTKIAGLTNGFLAPIFFASIGLQLDAKALTAVPGFLALLVIVAMLGKLIGAGLPAKWIGLSRREAIEVGISMSARGVVMLIVADIALRAGLFEQPVPAPPIVAHMFSAIVMVAIITTLLTPIILRQLLKRSHE